MVGFVSYYIILLFELSFPCLIVLLGCQDIKVNNEKRYILITESTEQNTKKDVIIDDNIRGTRTDYGEEENRVIRKSRKIIKRYKITVSGLKETIQRKGDYWYVVYTNPNPFVIGDGIVVRFSYPTGNFIDITKAQ